MKFSLSFIICNYLEVWLSISFCTKSSGTCSTLVPAIGVLCWLLNECHDFYLLYIGIGWALFKYGKDFKYFKLIIIFIFLLFRESGRNINTGTVSSRWWLPRDFGMFFWIGTQDSIWACQLSVTPFPWPCKERVLIALVRHLRFSDDRSAIKYWFVYWLHLEIESMDVLADGYRKEWASVAVWRNHLHVLYG